MVETTKHTPSLRVFLWSTPRSVSTAFLRSVSQIPGVQIVTELYAAAYWYGPENKKGFSRRWFEFTALNQREAKKWDILPNNLELDDSLCTYSFVKDTLEKDFVGKQFVFSKDHAVYLDGDFTMIPRGYKHTFLIRHPHRVYTSWKNVNERILKRKIEVDMILDNDLKNGMKSLFELMKYVENNGQTPVVVDADDLQTHPESILRQYCQATGIPFTDKMLQWERGHEYLNATVHPKSKLLDCKMNGGHSMELSCSTGFVPALPLLIREDVPPEMLPVVEMSMPFYEQMLTKKIKPRSY